MARSSRTKKASVDLAASVVRVSRIRRDPPPPVTVVSAAEIKEREALGVVLGIVTVALALVVIMIGFGNAGWTPSQHTIRYHASS